MTRLDQASSSSGDTRHVTATGPVSQWRGIEFVTLAVLGVATLCGAGQGLGF